MLGLARTLIVVYKDEMIVNQLKKLVETNDDNGEDQVVGTTDGSINIVAWNEKVWLDNKKAGNIKDKVLFLGDVKGTDKLIPIVDIQFNDYGVLFGWAGNQAVLSANIKDLEDIDKYYEFIDEISTYPIPDAIKKPLRKRESSAYSGSVIEHEPEDNAIGKKGKLMKTAKVAAAFGIGAAGAVATAAESAFKDRKALKQQMLFYGVVRMYQESLESFMNQ